MYAPTGDMDPEISLLLVELNPRQRYRGMANSQLRPRPFRRVRIIDSTGTKPKGRYNGIKTMPSRKLHYQERCTKVQ